MARSQTTTIGSRRSSTDVLTWQTASGAARPSTAAAAGAFERRCQASVAALAAICRFPSVRRSRRCVERMGCAKDCPSAWAIAIQYLELLLRRGGEYQRRLPVARGPTRTKADSRQSLPMPFENALRQVVRRWSTDRDPARRRVPTCTRPTATRAAHGPSMERRPGALSRLRGGCRLNFRMTRVFRTKPSTSRCMCRGAEHSSVVASSHRPSAKSSSSINVAASSYRRSLISERSPDVARGSGPLGRRPNHRTEALTRSARSSSGLHASMLLHLPRLNGYGKVPRVKNGPALAGQGAEAVRDAIAKPIRTLPEQLRCSLTWDQGAEMARHHELRKRRPASLFL